VKRLRRFIGWLRSPESPSDYSEADIATHRITAFLFQAVGYSTLIVFAGWIAVENPTDTTVADAVIPAALIFAVMNYTARGLRMTALRWRVEELQKDHDFRMTELRRQVEEVQEEQDLLLSRKLDEERGETE